jgi:serine/threonine-protein kinase RsbT
MTPDHVTRLPIGGDAHIAGVRQAVREAAVAAGFSLVEQTKIVTAASELARNTLVHGGGGHLELAVDGRGIRLTFTDEGPGIPDVAAALSDGYTTGNGLGLGLGGARRLVQDFTIDSAPGRGTVVRTFSRPRAGQRVPDDRARRGNQEARHPGHEADEGGPMTERGEGVKEQGTVVMRPAKEVP